MCQKTNCQLQKSVRNKTQLLHPISHNLRRAFKCSPVRRIHVIGLSENNLTHSRSVGEFHSFTKLSLEKNIYCLGQVELLPLSARRSPVVAACNSPSPVWMQQVFPAVLSVSLPAIICAMSSRKYFSSVFMSQTMASSAETANFGHCRSNLTFRR